jgi:hypothetical protein
MYLHFGIFLTDSHSLYCLVLSAMVNPSSVWSSRGHVLPSEHLHCFSIQGMSYMSILLQIALGPHSGRSESDVCEQESGGHQSRVIKLVEGVSFEE